MLVVAIPTLRPAAPVKRRASLPICGPKANTALAANARFLAATPESILTFQAFIGNYRGPGLTADHNISITVVQQEN
jgi:hypothetical protein